MQQLLKQDPLETKDLIICASKDYIFRSLLDHSSQKYIQYKYARIACSYRIHTCTHARAHPIVKL